MYRTDKQFMKDPSTASSRIYIGNIAETVVADNLEQKFRVYGKILGLVLQRGFGFIQYENEYQARQAIEAEHGAMFYGRKLNVKQAFAQSPNQNAPNKQFPPYQPPTNQNQNFQHPPQHQNMEKPKEVERDFNRPGPSPQYEPHHQQPQQQPAASPQKNIQQQQQQPQQQQSFPQSQQKSHPPPHHHNVQQQNDIPAQEAHEPPPVSNSDGGPPSRSGSSEPVVGGGGGDSGTPMAVNSPSVSSVGPPVGTGTAGPSVGGGGSVPENRRGKKRRRGGGRDRELDRYGLPMDYRNAPYYGRDDAYGPNYAAPVLDVPPERNDCEIIVVSKALTEYAEYIEQRLKSLGLIVDLLFPNEDVPIGRVLANISSRGCLYAILIMPQNEEHRSLTLDILHGIPQEHRNMPIEDALLLLTRNFDAYMHGEQTGRNANATGVNNLSERHPEGIQMLLNLLAENRQITTAQYDRLIKYLMQRRDLQSQYEISESSDLNQDQPSSKQTELQNRILDILNKSTEDPKFLESSLSAADITPTPLLNDPTVQKALDSLLLGDVLKSIGSTA